MKRIMIYGGSGSGKSTLARDIGAITGLPVVHIDPMYWQPGWVQRSKTETNSLILEAAAKDRWVFEGNSHDTIPQRIARADMVIFLDLPTWLRFWRVINRTFKFLGKTRPDMGAECPERFKLEFILVWVLGYKRRSHAKDVEIIENAPDSTQAIRLRSRKAVKTFLAELTGFS